MTRLALDQQVTEPASGSESSSASSEFEDFIYLISHDVRNSVRALIELPQWIEEDLAEAGVKLDGSVAESIELMNRHTGRLDRMLVDLLTFSRVGRMQELREIEVDLTLTDVLEEMRIPPGFNLSAELASNVLVLGDRDAPTLLTQLISNAIKHHDGTRGDITLRLENAAGTAILTVEDDGPGIPEEHRDRVFAAMTTLKPRDEVEGSGMGLAIVKKIAETYGGTVELSGGSNGRGTKVVVTFPNRGGFNGDKVSTHPSESDKFHK